MPGKPSAPVVVDYEYSILALLFPDEFPPDGSTPAAGRDVAAQMPDAVPDAPEYAGAPDDVPPETTPPESGPPDGAPPDVNGAPELPLETAGAYALPDAADDEAVDRSPFDRAELELVALSGRVAAHDVEAAPDPQVELPGLPQNAAPEAAEVSAPGRGALPEAVGSHGAPSDPGPPVLPGHPDAPPSVNPGAGEDMHIPDGVDILIA